MGGKNVKNIHSKSKGSEKKRIRINKTAGIVILTVLAVMIILGAVFGFVSLNEGELGIVDYDAYISNMKLGLDLNGGVYAVYTVERPDIITDDNAFKDTVVGTTKSLQDLLFSKGFPEAQVSYTNANGGYQIRVEVPNVEDPKKVFDLIGNPAELEMYEVDSNNAKVNESAGALIKGTDIRQANVGMNEGKFVIQLRFTSQGTKKFADVTAALNGKKLGIFINDELLMAPNVNTTISNGQAIIEGDYTYEQAYDYAVSIQSGAMGVTLKLEESNTISSALGEKSITHGLIAGGVGLLLIIIFMIARYRLLGVAASISLLIFALTYLFFLSIFPWVQITLPGIAGILLAIGMAVDANIIIFERIKEEHRNGFNKSISSSIKVGFKKSLSSILDGNITTIIGAVVLMLLATASIKSFAITLLIGIIISLISSLLVTRLILSCFIAFNNTSNALYGTTFIPEKDAQIVGDAELENAATEVNA